MAKLEDILLKLKIPSESTVVLENKLSGRKRRLWIEDNEDSLNKTKKDREEAVFTDNLKTKKIVANNHTKPSHTLLNNFSEPLNEKGSIKDVYNPDSLSLADLRGNPLKLIRFFHELVKKENDGNKTRRIKLKEIMQQFDISKDSARTALRFLLKQKLIFRIEFHPGQLGWSRYEIKKSMYEEIEKAIEIGFIDPLLLKESLDISKGFINNSSSNYISTTTDRGGQLPEEWQSINTEPLKEQGFSITQIKQLYALNITTPEVIQDSINRCAFSLEHNPKYKDHPNPLNLLMGILRKGQAWVESNYRSPKEIALRELIERKRAEQERLKKLEEEAFDLAVEEWSGNLSLDEIGKIAQKRGLNDITPKETKLRLYFKENIWATVKKDYLI